LVPFGSWAAPFRLHGMLTGGPDARLAPARRPRQPLLRAAGRSED
jgi:hypothetical protein